MIEQTSVLQVIQRIADDFRTIKVINSYCGMPVTNEARVHIVTSEEVILGVNEYQAVCMLLEGKVYLQSEFFPEVLRARVNRVDINRKEAAIANFSPAGDTIGKRIAGRIHPREVIEARISVEGFQLAGKIADLSTQSVGILAPANEIPASLSLEHDIEAALSFRLPEKEQEISVRGKVASFAYQPDTSTVRLGFKLLPTAETDRLLAEYFFDRQDEVMRELSLIYDSMRRELKRSNEPERPAIPNR